MLAAYGWWATQLIQFTWPARIAFGVPGALVLGLALARQGRRSSVAEGTRLAWAAIARGVLRGGGGSRGSRFWGAMVWWGLIGFAIAWELYSFISAEHDRLPTISHFIFDVTHNHVAETVGFVLWLSVGWYLARIAGKSAPP